MPITRDKAKQNFILLTKILLSVLSCWYIFRKTKQEQIHLLTVSENFSSLGIWAIMGITGLLLLFTIFNWYFEILKWKILVSEIKVISFKTAAFQSLIAHSMAVFTPNRIGDFAVKVLFFETPNQKRILGLNFLNNAAQLLATVAFGILGFLMMNERFTELLTSLHLNYKHILLAASMLVFLLLVLSFKSLMRRIKAKLSLTTPKKIQVFGYALLRYVIFSHQYFLLGWVLGWNVDYLSAMPFIFILYFAASFLPSIFILDAALKAGIGVYLFQMLGVSSILILAISSFMWLLNFALPALIGNVMLFQLKLKPFSATSQIRNN